MPHFFLAAADCALAVRDCLSGGASAYSDVGHSGESSEEGGASTASYSQLSDASSDLVAEPAGDWPSTCGEHIGNRLLLVPRGSHYRCVFRSAGRLRREVKDKVGHEPIEGDEGVPLVFSVENVGDFSVVPESLESPTKTFIMLHYWSSWPLSFGTAENAACASYDGTFIALSSNGAVLNGLSGDQFEELRVGIPVFAILGETEELTRWLTPTKNFAINEDGTISPAAAPDLALGFVWESDEQHADDKSNLLSFVRWFWWLSFSNFATLPFSFTLAYVGQSTFVYVFIVVKVLLVGTLQGVMLRRWERLQRSKRYENMKAVHEGWDHVQSLLNSPYQVVMSLLDLIEIVDPDLDAMSAGNAYASVTASEAAAYAASFRNIPGVSWVVDNIGLPGMLSALVILSSVYQLLLVIWVTMDMKNIAMKWPHCGFYQAHSAVSSRFWFNHRVFQGGDVAGLMATAKVAEVLWAYDTTLDPERRKKQEFSSTADRGGAFLAKGIFETIPSAWLTISMFALVFDTASNTVILQTLFSIASSYYTALKLLAGIVYHFWRAFLSPSTIWATPHIRNKLVGSLFIIVSLLVMAMRLVGVWRCPNHIWNLTSLSCVELAKVEQ